MKAKLAVLVGVSLLLLAVVLASGQVRQALGRRSGQRGSQAGNSAAPPRVSAPRAFREAANPLGPQQTIQQRIQRLAITLDLTEEQKSQAAKIFADTATALQPVQQQFRAAHQLLSDAARANNTAQIDQAASTIGALAAQMTAIQGRAEARFCAILMPDQQAKLPNGVRLFGGFGPAGGAGPRAVGPRAGGPRAGRGRAPVQP